MQALILLSWKHSDPFSLFVFSFVADSAIDQCEKRKIAAHSNVLSRVNACAELTYQNISGAHGFAAENLYTAPLPLAVAPLRELPPAFLCAIRLLSQLSFDCRDLQSRLILSVTALAAVAFAPLLFKDQNLFCPDLTNDFAGHLGVGDQG